MRPLSISTALFDGYSLDLAIDEIAACGATAVEPAFIKGYVEFDESAFAGSEARRLNSLAADAGLSVLALSAHLDLAAPGAVEMLRRRIRFAATLGARQIITNAGQAANRDRIVSVIDAVLPDCETAGVSLALENPGHGGGDLIGDGGEGAALVDEIASPHVRLNYDVGNIFTYSHERLRPERDIEKAIGRVSHVHLKDIVTETDGWRFAAIGDGVIDFRTLFRILPRDMPMAIELPLRLDRPNRADPIRRPARVDLEKIRMAIRSSLNFVAALSER